MDVQKLFEILFHEELFNEKEFNNFYEQYKNYVDLNFTYKIFDQADFKYTLLMCAAKKFENDGAAKIGWLLNTNMVNINCTDKFGTTTLMICTITADPETITLLCNYPTININQKNNIGETALMWMCKRSATMLFKTDNMKALINAGADPEIADDDGDTPLEIAETYENQETIDLIEDAINKKHRKK
jgi:ankyrin repeat protein